LISSRILRGQFFDIITAGMCGRILSTSETKDPDREAVKENSRRSSLAPARRYPRKLIHLPVASWRDARFLPLKYAASSKQFHVRFPESKTDRGFSTRSSVKAEKVGICQRANQTRSNLERNFEKCRFRTDHHGTSSDAVRRS
jgi:hypothetical protein